MNTWTPKRSLTSLCTLSLIWGVVGLAVAQDKAPASPVYPRLHFADYDSEPRRADGHVDRDALLARLKELHVTTYYWLVWHAATDWDDLKLFLPKAAQANLQVWVYLVPPTESAPQDTNLTGWVIDDFYANHAFFTPAAVRDFQGRAKGINPRLVFLPLMYYGEIRRP